MQGGKLRWSPPPIIREESLLLDLVDLIFKSNPTSFRSVKPQGEGVEYKGGKVMRQEKAPNLSQVHLALRLKSEGSSPELQTN